jgi:hypothetical protein
MRRTLAAAVVAMSLAATGAAVSPSFADDGFRTRSPGTATSAPTVAAPSDVLRRAEAALDGVLAGTRRPDATLALRDLFATLPRLSTTDRAQARAILARPTQGDDDPYGDGYTVGSKRRCTPKICIHWVPTTADAPPSGRWVTRSLRTMKSVWTKEVGKLGYRRPVTDGRRGGGSDQFDVYLSDVGAKGLYGYCAPEFTKPGYRRLASGYCVLDNDFARAQFGARPSNSLKVTAAHEFFHAIQFAYDYLEDPWMMEATATWMEERYADGVNDNRQYLPKGQLVETFVPLDTFDSSSTVQYGNWVFFEYLSKRFGQGVVRRIWKQAGSFKGDGKTYSTDAVKRVLPRKASFKKVFSQFSSANVTPSRSYPEGRFWPSPILTSQGTLGRGESTTGTLTIDHMSTQDVRVVPEANLDRRKFKLRISVDGPASETAPAAAIVRQTRSGRFERMPLGLNRDGVGSQVVPFNDRQTKRVWLVVSNASTRFDCRGDDFTYSCSGTPRDDRRKFTVTFKVITRS